jgi:hypothetical protein
MKITLERIVVIKEIIKGFILNSVKKLNKTKTIELYKRYFIDLHINLQIKVSLSK